MPKYYCPYCPSLNYIHLQKGGNQFVCSRCGDFLVEVPLIKPTQLFALITAAAFLIPLILLLVYSIYDIKKQPPETSNQEKLLHTALYLE